MLEREFILNKFLSLGIEINEHYLNRYIKLILVVNETADSEGYGEYHHILPKSLFPEFEKRSVAAWNQKRISARAHYLCHWLLWKAFPGDVSMFYGFYRISNRLEDTRQSRTYEKLKQNHSERISDRNRTLTGENNPNWGGHLTRGTIHHSEEYKKEVSKRFLGKRFVKDKETGESIQIAIEDFDSSKHEGIRDKGFFTYRNKLTGECRLLHKDDVDLNLWEGVSAGRLMSDEQKQQISSRNSKRFRLVTPSGEEVYGANLTKFCREQGISISRMMQLCKGKLDIYKGWTGEYL